MIPEIFKKSFTCLLLILASCYSVGLYAHEDPAELVANTSEQIKNILKKENGKNTAQIRKEVEDVLYPRFDFTRMTALAVGKFWKEATVEQKDALASEFKILLSNTYFNTMLRYRDAKINVKQDVLIENEGKQATVKSAVQPETSKEAVAIDYVLYNTPDGWKVFNVNVEGASLVTVYRNQFGEEISKNGIDSLVKSLHDKNQSMRAADSSPGTAVDATTHKG